MARRISLPTLTVILVLLGFRPAAIAASSIAHDETAAKTPKGVALSFAKALQSGDAAGVQAVVLNGEKNKDRIGIAVQTLSAMRQLHDAALRRFGEEGASLLAAKMDLAKDIAAAEPKVEADHAEIAIEDGYPVVLRKIEEQWKVDMEKMLDGVGKSPTLALVMEQLSQEIKAGKYKSAQEAQEAMSAKLVKAGPDAVGVGDEDQRKAARAVIQRFVDGLFEGNGKAVGEVCLAGEGGRKAIAAMAAAFASYRRMGEAATARFGPAGEVLSPRESMLTKQLAQGPIVIDGDQGGIIGSQPPLGLKRVDGQWKIDLAGSNRDGALARSAAAFSSMQTACDETAAEIKAGKYNSSDQSMAAFQQKFLAKMRSGPTTRPLVPGSAK